VFIRRLSTRAQTESAATVRKYVHMFYEIQQEVSHGEGT
jgi:hypothetical protein